MEQRLMAVLDTIKEGQKFSFSMQQHCSFQHIYEALDEFRGQVQEWEAIRRKQEEEKASPQNEGVSS